MDIESSTKYLEHTNISNGSVRRRIQIIHAAQVLERMALETGDIQDPPAMRRLATTLLQYVEEFENQESIDRCIESLEIGPVK